MYTIKQRFKSRYLIFLTVFFIFFTGCGTVEETQKDPDKIITTSYNPLSKKSSPDVAIKQELSTQENTKDNNGAIPVLDNNSINEHEVNEVYIHFIDVGQADSIFIDYGDVDVLIDGGNVDDGELVVDYLKSLGTDDIELMVATHAHEDHIGGLDTVIKYFDVEKVIKPDVIEYTKTNEYFENAVNDKNIPVDNPSHGKTIEFGELKFTVISDKTKQYSKTNNLSIVLKMTFGDTSFLFTGDAESDAEHDIVASGIDINADVLKIGHHGSASSTTANFLRKVAPDYAVISVGENNSYGHPDPIILNRLNLQDIATMQTKDMRSIVFSTNGTELNFTIESEARETTDKTETSNPTMTDKTEGDTKPDQSDADTMPTVIISKLDKKTEFVEITNISHQNINLTQWYIVSGTGNQIFTFPDGYTLEAEQSIKIASGGAVGDLHWTTSNIWNNSKSDPAELYNNSGVLVHRWED